MKKQQDTNELSTLKPGVYLSGKPGGLPLPRHIAKQLWDSPKRNVRNHQHIPWLRAECYLQRFSILPR